MPRGNDAPFGVFNPARGGKLSWLHEASHQPFRAFTASVRKPSGRCLAWAPGIRSHAMPPLGMEINAPPSKKKKRQSRAYRDELAAQVVVVFPEDLSGHEHHSQHEL